MKGRELRIVLDPGHGGEAPLGRSSANRASGEGGLEERHLAMDLAFRLDRHLRHQGRSVHLTRRADHNLTLGARAAVAHRARADVFLSLHFGAGRPPGPVTCVHPESGERSRALARGLQRALVELTGQAGSELRTLPLAVLDPRRHAEQTAAALVEPVVLNAEGAERLADPAWRERLAGALARALDDYLRDPAPSPEQTARPAALVVGVDRYVRPEWRCSFAVRDAERVAGTLPLGPGLRAVGTLRDDAASAAAILAGLEQAARGAEGGNALLYFSGRGTTVEGQPCLLSADGQALGAVELGRAAARGGASGLLVLAEAGHGDQAESEGRSTSSRGLALNTGPPPLPVRWIGAAAPGGEAWEHPGLGHGLFTSALLPYLRTSGLDITDQGLLDRLAEDMEALDVSLGVLGSARPWRSSSRPALLLGGTPPPRLPPILHYVPLVPQTSEMSCWAAAAAMVVGWRETRFTDDAGVAQAAGVLEAFHKGLRPRDTEELARAHGLSAESALLCRPADLYGLLSLRGPLWVGEADPDLHVVVVYGMDGDGTLDGSFVQVADPWPVGRGERYTIPFRRLVDNLRGARAVVGVHVQLLHSGGRAGAQRPSGSGGGSPGVGGTRT